MGNYGITAVTREQVRAAIYQERFIEFVFKGQRFWDLKRSRTLTNLTGFVEEGLASTLKSAQLPVNQNKKDNYLYMPEDFIFTPGPVLKANESSIKFSVPEKFYFAPIPIAQIQKNDNLQQTKDWGGDFNPTLE